MHVSDRWARLVAWGALFVFGVCVSSSAEEPTSSTGLTLAVADFSGPDKELGRFLADTLLTDLAQSDKLRLTERAEIRQAFAELKLQSTGLTEPQQVKKVGKLVGADRLIVGSYFVRDEQILLNARTLDVRTGRVTPGGAANVSGSRRDLLTLVQKLARLFHRRVTGTDLPQDADVRERVLKTASVESPSPRMAAGRSVPGGGEITLPDNARSTDRPNNIVTERDLAALIARVQRSGSALALRPLQGRLTSAPVTRLRVLAALVKSVCTPDEIASPPDRSALSLPSDASDVPSWGTAFMVIAVERGWWASDHPLRPYDIATRAFVNALLENLPQGDAPTPPRRRRIAPEVSDPDACTGLIVDARHLSVERTMSVRILDEDGNVIYPDQRSLPDNDWLQDNGMADYVVNRRDAPRSGSHPIVVRALDTTGFGHDDLVVSNEVAARIAAENRHGHFLQNWKVCILTR